MTTETVNRNVTSVAWKRCGLCRDSGIFKSPREFCRHLRDCHCDKEGGSYVCRYGMNGVCPSLPVEGVSDRDYEDHVARDHVCLEIGAPKNNQTRRRSQEKSSDGSNSSSRSTTPVQPSNEPQVVQDQYKWTVFNSKVNLPAALNDPRLVKRETDFFTKTWGEEFTFEKIAVPTNYLPEIGREHFARYLKKTSKRYKEHLKNAENPPTPNTPSGLPTDVFPSLNARQLEKTRSELEQIPKLFLHPGFSLENPDTFNAVFPWQQIEATRHGEDGPRQSSKLLQEKMSHYLDIVEVQIAKQISMRSDAFFHAMTSHDELQEYMKKTCAAIKHLRDKMHTLDSLLAKGPLSVMQLARSRTNAIKLYDKLKLMSTVHQTQPTIQVLLTTNEFVGALDLITTTQEVLAQELSGIQCFRHLGSQLVEMEKLIDKMMEADFVKYATADLNRPLVEGYQKMNELHLEEDVSEEKLRCIVMGLLRQHKFNFIDVYREEACTAIKAVVKQSVVEAVSAADGIDTDGSLADQMRLLNYTQWMILIKSIFANIIIILQRVKVTHDVMCAVIEIAAGHNPDHNQQNGDADCEDEEEDAVSAVSRSMSLEDGVDITVTDPEYHKVISNLKDMLCQVCDHAHDRCVKVLIARAKDGFLERLSSHEFVSLSRAIEKFVNDCESVCGRRSTSLRGCLQSQSNRFVNRFHEERKLKLTHILDIERWKQADVPCEFQALVTYVENTGKLGVPERKPSEGDHASPPQVLEVNGEQFAVVGTVLLLLKMIMEYCQCVDDIPPITADLLTRLIEILKTFNSRTCQLVLGAGALQLVGLKTITTKNLALASRCLQLIVVYIPQVKTHFEERLAAKHTNMLKHFDQVLKDYNDHISEITNKLVAIMSGMCEDLLSKWEVKAPMPSPCFRNICKQMGKFHEAISELLPSQQVQTLFQRINASFKQNLREQLKKLNVTNDNGPQHGLVMADLAFYTGSVKSIPGLQNVEENIQDVWR